jgi:hypothetical protein
VLVTLDVRHDGRKIFLVSTLRILGRSPGSGMLVLSPRARWIRQNGRKRCVQWSNAYLLNVPSCFRKDEGDFAISGKSSESGNRPPTTAADIKDIKNPPPMPADLAASLARLGNAIAARAEMENEQARSRQL